MYGIYLNELRKVDIRATWLHPRGVMRDTVPDSPARAKSGLMQLSEPDSQRLAAFFRVLADPARIRIIHCLRQTELCVSDLARASGITESAVSHHLRDMRLQRLVRARRLGRQGCYSLANQRVGDLVEDSLLDLKVRSVDPDDR